MPNLSKDQGTSVIENEITKMGPIQRDAPSSIKATVKDLRNQFVEALNGLVSTAARKRWVARTERDSTAIGTWFNHHCV